MKGKNLLELVSNFTDMTRNLCPHGVSRARKINILFSVTPVEDKSLARSTGSTVLVELVENQAYTVLWRVGVVLL